MKKVPDWIYDALKKEKVKCQDCGFLFKGANIVAVGVRSSLRKPGIEAMFIELMCFKCNNAIMFELQEMDLSGLAYEILDEETKPHKKEPIKKEYIKKEYIINPDKGSDIEKKGKKSSKLSSKSKITLTEIRESADFLNSIESHDDLLLEMGMSPEDIEEYKTKGKEERS